MLVSTTAIVLHTFPYGETSKIVRLATRDHGVQSAIAKGAQRPRSRFGARLQPLSQGVAQYYYKATRDLHTLSAFDVGLQRPELAADIRRYATASALAELVLRCAPPDPHPEVFDRLAQGLDQVGAATADRLPLVGVAAMWQLVRELGFGPSLEQCARDGVPLPEGPAPFSVAEGGFLCAACARGLKTTTLQPEDRAGLDALVRGDTDGLDVLAPRTAQAHRRLVARFVARHLSEDRDLKALTFWETLPWTATP